MFETKPEGAITVRKLRRLFPFLNKAAAGNTIDLAWALILVFTPLMVTPLFPKAMKVLWEAIEKIEAISKEDPNQVEIEQDIDEILNIIASGLDKVDG